MSNNESTTVTVLGLAVSVFGLGGYHAYQVAKHVKKELVREWTEFTQPGGVAAPAHDAAAVEPFWIEPLAWGAGLGLTATGLAVGFGALKVHHLRNTMNPVTYRITPREGVEVKPEKVIQLAGHFKTLHRSAVQRLLHGRHWLRWIIYRDSEGKIHYFVQVPEEKAHTVATHIEECYPLAEVAKTDAPAFPKKVTQGGHFVLDSWADGAGLYDDGKRIVIGSILKHLPKNAAMELRLSPVAQAAISEVAKQTAREIRKNTNKSGEETKITKDLTERYMQRNAYEVTLSLWSAGANLKGLADTIIEDTKGLKASLRWVPYRWKTAPYRNVLRLPWVAPLPVLHGRMVLSNAEVANFLMFPPKGDKVWDRLVALRENEEAATSDTWNEGYTVGFVDVGGEKRKIKVPKKNFEYHIITTGATGTGKGGTFATFADDFIEEWIADPANFPGITIIDPAQLTIKTFVNRLLDAERRGLFVDWTRIHYFHVGPNDYPVGLNLLHKEKGDDIEAIGGEVTEAILSTFSGELSRGSRVLGNSVKSLLYHPEPRTMWEIPKLFENPRFLREIKKYIKNPSVLEFWRQEEEKQVRKNEKSKIPTDALETNLDAILTRLDPFFNDMWMQRMFGQRHNVITPMKFFNEGHIVLIDFTSAPKRAFSIISRYILATYRRQIIQRNLQNGLGRHHILCIDEAHEFDIGEIHKIITGTRKYGLSAWIITQDLNQFDDEITKTLKQNAGVVISLKQGPDEAAKAAELMVNKVSKQELMDLNNLEAYVYARNVGVTFMNVHPPAYVKNGEMTAEGSKDAKQLDREAIVKCQELQQSEGTYVLEVDNALYKEVTGEDLTEYTEWKKKQKAEQEIGGEEASDEVAATVETEAKEEQPTKKTTKKTATKKSTTRKSTAKKTEEAPVAAD